MKTAVHKLLCNKLLIKKTAYTLCMDTIKNTHTRKRTLTTSHVGVISVHQMMVQSREGNYQKARLPYEECTCRQVFFLGFFFNSNRFLIAKLSSVRNLFLKSLNLGDSSTKQLHVTTIQDFNPKCIDS